jgi:uncharacterized membrane protein
MDKPLPAFRVAASFGRGALAVAATMQAQVDALPTSEQRDALREMLNNVHSFVLDAIDDWQKIDLSAQLAASTMPAEGGAFEYNMGMDVTRRRYYTIRANSEEEATTKLRAYAVNDAYYNDVDETGKDDTSTYLAGTIGYAIDTKCVTCEAEVEDEDEHVCQSEAAPVG